MAKAKKKTISKSTKKSWFKVYAPSYLGEALIGEILAEKQEDLLNKTLTINLNAVLPSSRRMQYNIKLRCTALKDKDGASTNLIAYSMMPAAVKRLVRPGKDKIEDSFLVKTKDNVIVRIKPLLITMNRMSESKDSLARKGARAVLAKYIAKQTYEEFVNSVITKTIDKELFNIINRIVPLKIAEIREFSIEDKAKTNIETGSSFDLSPYIKKQQNHDAN